jgi:NAD(P) transhydrogenase subunit alpha
VPLHASQMYGRNVLTLVQHLLANGGAFQVDVGDEITGAMAVTHGGAVRFPAP